MSTSSSTSNTQSTVGATNTTLNNLFTSLFSGGAGASGVQGLQGILNGSTLSSNIASLTKTYTDANAQSTAQGIAAIKEANGAGGTRFSTDTSGQVGQFLQQTQQNINTQATNTAVTQEGQQLGAASSLLSALVAGGNQYYTNSSNTKSTQTGSVLSTIGGIVGDAVSAGTSAVSAYSTLFM